jgi:hypothetical protein
MDYLLFTLSCFIGFNTEFACRNIATPRAVDTHLECIVRGKQRVAQMNDLVYPNQYGDQIVTVCLPWEAGKFTQDYIPPKSTASQIQAHTQQHLITVKKMN